MATYKVHLFTCLFIFNWVSGCLAIITNGNKLEGAANQYVNRTPAHLISITEAPKHAEAKLDSREGPADSARGAERQYSSPSHHYPEYAGLSSYGGGYDFSGSFGGGFGGSFGGGHGGSENSLESTHSYGGGGEGGSGESYGHHHYPPVHHKPNPKHVALKGLLVPLAGVALLGAAAALVSNPILLQLGVITGKKRRRRSTDNEVSNLSPEEAEAVKQKLSDIALLERFMAQIPKEQAVSQEKQLLANYLSCSGSAGSNGTSSACLERLTCELHHPDSEADPLEKHVMSIVTSEIIANEYVPEGVKERVRSAATTGSKSGNCAEFPCNDLEGN